MATPLLAKITMTVYPRVVTRVKNRNVVSDGTPVTITNASPQPTSGYRFSDEDSTQRSSGKLKVYVYDDYVFTTADQHDSEAADVVTFAHTYPGRYRVQNAMPYGVPGFLPHQRLEVTRVDEAVK